MHYLLLYDVVDDYVTARQPYRNEHLRLLWEASDRGEVLLGGAFVEPADGAVIFFQGDSPAAAERFAQNDPYVKNGVVTRWRVRQWNTVAGPQAANPVRPASA